jgi:hypothetical protein
MGSRLELYSIILHRVVLCPQGTALIPDPETKKKAYNIRTVYSAGAVLTAGT